MLTVFSLSYKMLMILSYIFFCNKYSDTLGEVTATRSFYTPHRCVAAPPTFCIIDAHNKFHLTPPSFETKPTFPCQVENEDVYC